MSNCPYSLVCKHNTFVFVLKANLHTVDFVVLNILVTAKTGEFWSVRKVNDMPAKDISNAKFVVCERRLIMEHNHHLLITCVFYYFM